MDNLQGMPPTMLSREQILEIFVQPAITIQKLKDKNIREQIVDRIITEQSWFQTVLAPRILQLQDGSEKNWQGHQLVRSFDLLLEDIRDRAIGGARNNKYEFFTIALTSLLYLSPDMKGSPFWYDFLKVLTKDNLASDVIRRNWQRLLNIAQQVFSPDDFRHERIVSPLLKVQPVDFANLLALQLPTEWNYLATVHFLSLTSTPLSPDIVRGLEHHFSQVEELIQQLFDNPPGVAGLRTGEQFFDRLVRSNYEYIYTKRLFFRILHTQSRSDVQLVERLFTAAHLSDEDAFSFFKDYGVKYLKLYPTSRTFLHLMRRYLQNDATISPLTQKQIASIANALGELPKALRTELLADVAISLDGLVDSPIRLGLIVATMSTILGATDTNATLLFMAERSNEAIREVISSKQQMDEERDATERMIAGFAAYLQFALDTDTLYEVSPAERQERIFPAQFLDTLLQDSTDQLFNFINRLVERWPADLRAKWQVEDESRNPAYQRASRVARIARGNIGRPSSASTASAPSADSMPSTSIVSLADFEGLDFSPNQLSLLDKEVKATQKHWERIQNSKGTENFAQFWLEHRAVLISVDNMSLLQPEEWLRMKLAYEFYITCKRAAALQEISVAAEQGILNVDKEIRRAAKAMKSLGRSLGLSLTRKEQKRIKLAKLRVNQYKSQRQPP